MSPILSSLVTDLFDGGRTSLITCLVTVMLMTTTASGESLPPWTEQVGTGALLHVSSGLTFPPKVGDLGRQQYSSGNNPYTPGAASVSYGATDSARLLVTLIPVPEDAPGSVEKLFAARVLLLRQQQPDLTEIDAATVAVSCRGAGPGQLAGFGLGPREEWLYATSVQNFVIYVRATRATTGSANEARRALSGLLTTMTWGCGE